VDSLDLLVKEITPDLRINRSFHVSAFCKALRLAVTSIPRHKNTLRPSRSQDYGTALKTNGCVTHDVSVCGAGLGIPKKKSVFLDDLAIKATQAAMLFLMGTTAHSASTIRSAA